MEVVYRKTILEKLMDVSNKAFADRKVIEKVILDKNEWEQLLEATMPFRMFAPDSTTMVFGMKVECRG